MMGKWTFFNYIYCARPVTGRHHANEYMHDVKAGLSLSAHMGFFVLLMISCSILMNRALKKCAACKLHSTILFLPKSDISWV